jgi:Transcriptional regulators
MTLSIARTCMRDSVRELVVSRILDGTYPPGTQLKELMLAAECNVSQGPVREALRELEALGMVQSERYRGTRVCAADLQQLREAYELRAMLEERAAALAVPCAAADIARLREHLGTMRAARRNRDQRLHAEAAVGFHRNVMAMAHNATLLRVWDSLHWDIRARIAIQRIEEQGIDLGVFVEAHEKIVQLLQAGDGAGAGRSLRELVDSLLQSILPTSTGVSSTRDQTHPADD